MGTKFRKIVLSQVEEKDASCVYCDLEIPCRKCNGPVCESKWVFEYSYRFAIASGYTIDRDDCLLVADHVIPKSRNGADILSNLAPACWHHNASKADKYLDEWMPSTFKNPYVLLAPAGHIVRIYPKGIGHLFESPEVWSKSKALFACGFEIEHLERHGHRWAKSRKELDLEMLLDAP